jgi:hypothetical protein
MFVWGIGDYRWRCHHTAGICLLSRRSTHLKSLAPPLSSSPMIKPNRPRTDEKISMTKILTKLRKR